MYTVCTVRLSQAIDAPFLMAIPRVFVFVAVMVGEITIQVESVRLVLPST